MNISRCVLAMVLLLPLALPVRAQVGTAFDLGNLRVHDRYEAPRPEKMDSRFRQTGKITRSPVFGNLPFLSLRPGDKLIKGQFWYQPGKGKHPVQWSRAGVYLQRGSNTWPLYVEPDEAQWTAMSGDQIMLFNWEFSRPHADAIAQIVKPRFDVSQAQLALLEERLLPHFAETISDRVSDFLPSPGEEHPGQRLPRPGFQYQTGQGDGRGQRFVYAGFGFDEEENTLSQYRLFIGSSSIRQERAPLIVGPPRVESVQEQLQQPAPSSPESSLSSDPLARRLLDAKAARYHEFRDIVKTVLGTSDFI